MKPIILTTREIRGLLDGTIDTIRREIKPQPAHASNWWPHSECGKITFYPNTSRAIPKVLRPPFQPGEVLYGRESWHQCYDSTFRYAATDPPNKGWSSPATMPREAARLFLRVEDVRAERVQEITLDGCRKEGCCCSDCPLTGDHSDSCKCDARYHNTWNEEHAKRGLGWDANPWTWVYKVKTISADEAREGDGEK